MKKLFKVAAVLIALVLVLLGGATILLHIYLPPEKAKALVLERMSAQFKRQVQLGSVSVGILSGLQMSDLKISESPNFSKGTFLSSDQFSLKVALTPLLFRKVIVRQIVLKHPEVTIVRFADGKTFNFSDLTASTTAPAPGGAPAGQKESMPFLLLVSRAEIQKGAVHFQDHSPAQQSLDIAPFDLRLKNVSLTEPFSIQTSMHVKSKGADLALTFGGDANLLSGTFNIKQANLVSRQTKIAISGQLEKLKTSSPSIDLKIDIPQLVLADIAPFMALPSNISIDKPIKGNMTVKGDQKSMQFQSQMSLGSLHVNAHGQIRNPVAQPVLTVHVETNAFPLEEVLKYAPASVPPGIALKGNNQLSADISGTPANSQFAVKWIGTDLAITKADQFSKAAGIPLEVSAVGDGAGSNKITLKNLTVKLGSNQMDGFGTYETRGAQSLINFSAKGTNWAVQDLAKVSPLLAPYHPTGTLSFNAHATGTTDAPQTTIQTSADIAMSNIKQDYFEDQNMQLKWNLTDVTPDMAKANGTASLKGGPGKILNVDKLANSSSIGKILLSPLEELSKLQEKGLLKQVNLPSLQSIPFDSLIGDYVLRSGIVDIKTFNLNGPDLSIQDTGTVGLAGAQPLNMAVVMKLAAGSVGGTVGQILQDENGRPTLKFTVTGTVPNPKVTLDLGDVKKKAVQQLGQELIKNPNVKDAVDNLQKSFQNIFH